MVEKVAAPQEVNLQARVVNLQAQAQARLVQEEKAREAVAVVVAEAPSLFPSQAAHQQARAPLVPMEAVVARAQQFRLDYSLDVLPEVDRAARCSVISEWR